MSGHVRLQIKKDNIVLIAVPKYPSKIHHLYRTSFQKFQGLTKFKSSTCILIVYVCSAKISFQIASECNDRCPYFQKFQELRATYFTPPLWGQNMCCIFNYRFKKCQNACESVFVSKWSLQFQLVSDAVRRHHLSSLFSTFSLQFQIVSNVVRCTI